MANFEPTPKQDEMMHAAFTPGVNEIYYGGAAGGGKTFGALALFIALCKIYPGSRWAVIREDREKLIRNTLPKYWQLVPPSFHQSFVNFTATMTNGSEIIFTGENYDKDKELTKFDGFDVNGFLLEECQELQEKMYNKARLRAGRHILTGTQPKKLIVMTGNPSQNWSKTLFYDPWEKGELSKPRCFIPALMSDNPYLDKEYVASLETLDYITYERFVKGNWDIVDVGRPFAYAFDRRRHLKKLPPPTTAAPLYLSFDFNVDPITALACQHNRERTQVRFHREFRLSNSNIYELCAAIKRAYPGYYYYVTGDASGNNNSALVRDRLNYYRVIMQELNISAGQIIVPKANPGLGNNRVLVNSLFGRHPEILIDPEQCRHLIEDLLYCEVNQGGDLDKTKNKRMTHLLDCLRYYFNTWFVDFVRYKI